jgi:hypothetical protein
LNACLRLSFATVIDYHRSDHRDHFHCDMNRGRGRTLLQATMVFVQEALSLYLGRRVPETGKLDPATKAALGEFAGVAPAGLSDRGRLNAALDRLFSEVAAGRRKS